MIDSRLITFKTLCKVLNYTKTAEILHITQPAVSQHIKYLETEYGAKLFNQNGKTITLTNAGEILYQFVKGMEASSQRTKLMMSLPQESCTPIHFGSTLTIGEYTMPRLIEKILMDFPNIKINMNVANTETLLSKLDNGAIDFALIEGQYEKNKYNSALFSEESFIGICSPEHNFSRNMISFNQIFNERIILREKGSGTREIFEQILHEHNITMNQFQKITEIGCIGAIKELVSLNQGITFLYKEAVKQDLKDGRLCKIEIDGFDAVREFNFVFLKESLHAQEFYNWYNYFIKNRK